MANIFEAYVGALGDNGQLLDLEEWVEQLWECGVFGDLDEKARAWMSAERVKLVELGRVNREKKRRKKEIKARLLLST